MAMARSRDVLANLDVLLTGTGHDRWGWVIYRCTYNSDDDWARFMEALKATTARALDSKGATDTAKALAEKQIWTVIDDRERLENASKSDVRKMFNDWVHSPEAAAQQPNAKHPPPEVRLARYLYCMHVDEGSLRSVLDNPWYSPEWYVNIINRRWVSEEDQSDEEDEYDDEDEEVPEEVRQANIWPEIEGCTEEDVGWFKASQGIMLGYYVALCNPNSWDAYYERPPKRAR